MSYNDKDFKLTPLKESPKPIEFGAFDTETLGNEARYVDGGALFEGQYERFSDPDDLIKFMCKPKYKGIRWFAHNLTYDLGVLIKYLPEQHKVLFLGGKAMLAKLYPVKSRTHYLSDSWRLAAGVSLADIGRKIGLPKYETPAYLLPPSLTESDEYKQETKEQVDIEVYMKRDVEIVDKYISLFQEEINRLGGNVKHTLASTSMDLFRRAFLEDEYFTPFESRNDFARLAYYGGRVEPFILGELEHVNIYDINSLYPFIMRHGIFPNPNKLRGVTGDISLSTIMNYEGCSEVTIRIPQTHIPILPFSFAGRLYFPSGTVRAVWTHIELRAAIKRGAKILEIHQGLYSTETCTPFNNYVDSLYALRLHYQAQEDPREYIIKIMLNSLYGKFGMRKDGLLQQLITAEEWHGLKNQEGYDTHIFSGDVYFSKDVPSFRQPVYINTLWAAYVTAQARLLLHKYMEKLDRDVIYCDTDSIFTHAQLETSKALGDMKLIYENVDVQMIGAKCYKIHNEEKILATKVRGVPSLYQEKFLTSHEASYMKSLGFFEASRRDLSPSTWVEMSKKSNELTPKRFYSKGHQYQNSVQTSRPLTLVEVFAQHPQQVQRLILSGLA